LQFNQAHHKQTMMPIRSLMVPLLVACCCANPAVQAQDNKTGTGIGYSSATAALEALVDKETASRLQHGKDLVSL
jgi:hypothetical protein